jgi:hypothetical protein
VILKSVGGVILKEHVSGLHFIWVGDSSLVGSMFGSGISIFKWALNNFNTWPCDFIVSFIYFECRLNARNLGFKRLVLSRWGLVLVLCVGHVASLNHGTTKYFVEVLFSTYLTMINGLKGVCSDIP